MEKFYRVLRYILSDLDNLKIAENSENAEALKTLKSSLYDLTQCIGDYINEMDN